MVDCLPASTGNEKNLFMSCFLIAMTIAKSIAKNIAKIIAGEHS